MSNTPPDWVLLEAAKRFDWGDDIGELREYYTAPCCASEKGYRALCDMIAKYEQPPLDPLVIEARTICAEVWSSCGSKQAANEYRTGAHDECHGPSMRIAMKALQRGQELAATKGGYTK